MLKYLETDEKQGLSERTAGRQNRAIRGKPVARSKKNIIFSEIYPSVCRRNGAHSFGSCRDFVVLALLGGEKADFFEPILILVIVVCNAVIGVMQENKAEKALGGLEQFSRTARQSHSGREGKAHRTRQALSRVTFFASKAATFFRQTHVCWNAPA